MNKLLENTKKFLTVVLVAAIAFLVTNTNTKAVTDTIQAGEAEDLPAYISTATFAAKKTTSGEYLYCLNMTQKTTKNTTLHKDGVLDAGYAYIILNGYPNKSFTGETLKDYYITQTAIWWYQDETAGTTNLGTRFKETGADDYNMRQYVKALVDGAIEAKNAGYTNTTVSVNTNSDVLTLDGTYYVSEAINVSTNANTYTVSLSGAPEGTKIVGANSGNETTTFNSDEAFIVKVPTTSIKESSLEITVNVEANGVIYKAYKYVPEEQTMQSVTPGLIEAEEDKVSTSIKLGLTTSKVTVTKLDEKTDQPLAGAVLVLKNEEGKEITRWTSTINSHVIRNLSDGKYTITEETAPEGYEKSSDVVEFLISRESDDVTVKFYNAPKEKTVVTITKIDSETGNTLPGAVLVIKDANGKEVKRFTTTDSSEVITGLEYGKYTVSEVSAPAGYKTSDEVVEFTLDDEHISYQIKFANYKEVKVPDTKTTSLLFTILGIAVIGSGLGFVYKNGKKAK